MTFAESSPAGKEASKVLARAHSLMRRIENTVSDSPQAGRELNAYGSYFKTSALQKVLSIVDEAEALSHLDGACEYARAGFLLWAGQFQAAADIYSRLIDSRPNYTQPSRNLLALALCRLGQFSKAKTAIEAYNAVLEADPSSKMPRLNFARLGFPEH